MRCKCREALDARVADGDGGACARRGKQLCCGAPPPSFVLFPLRSSDVTLTPRPTHTAADQQRPHLRHLLARRPEASSFALTLMSEACSHLAQKDKTIT